VTTKINDVTENMSPKFVTNYLVVRQLSNFTSLARHKIEG